MPAPRVRLQTVPAETDAFARSAFAVGPGLNDSNASPSAARGITRNGTKDFTLTDHTLQLIVRTPREVVLDLAVRSVRVPTETGQVGLRPRCEALVLPIEASLVVARTLDGVRFIGTAGGLLTCDGATATIVTPLAVTGDNQEQIQQALDQALSEPTEDMQARASLERLEGGILQEIHSERQQRGRVGGVLG